MATILKMLEEKLDQELFEQIKEAAGEEFDKDVVPMSRLNRVIKQRNQLREQLEELEDTPPKTSEPTGKSKANKPDGEGATEEPNLDELIRQKDLERDEAIKALQVRFAALEKLREAKVVDPELAYTLLDASKIVLGEDGALTGLEEQVKGLAESKAYLFEDTTPNGTGRGSGSGGAGEDAVDSAIAQVMSRYLPTEE